MEAALRLVPPPPPRTVFVKVLGSSEVPLSLQLGQDTRYTDLAALRAWAAKTFEAAAPANAPVGDLCFYMVDAETMPLTTLWQFEPWGLYGITFSNRYIYAPTCHAPQPMCTEVSRSVFFIPCEKILTFFAIALSSHGQAVV